MRSLIHSELRQTLAALFASTIGVTVAECDISMRSKHGHMSIPLIRYGYDASKALPLLRANIDAVQLLETRLIADINATVGHVNFRLTDEFFDRLTCHINSALPTPTLPPSFDTCIDVAISKLYIHMRCEGKGCPHIDCYQRLLWEAYTACDIGLLPKQRTNAAETAAKHVLSFAGSLNDGLKVTHYSVAGDYSACIARLLLTYKNI